jgi:RimJ/RimL family protein N-acetyltransferase
MNDEIAVYYRSPERPAPQAELPDSLTDELWRPSTLQMTPRGMSRMEDRVWWCYDRLHLFRGREYSIYLLQRNGMPVHRSSIFPKYYSFPFMQPDDLQIGFTFTEPSARGNGLASLAIQRIIQRLAKPGRGFWYLTKKSNAGSVRAAERAGLNRVATAQRRVFIAAPLVVYTF